MPSWCGFRRDEDCRELGGGGRDWVSAGSNQYQPVNRVWSVDGDGRVEKSGVCSHANRGTLKACPNSPINNSSHVERGEVRAALQID